VPSSQRRTWIAPSLLVCVLLYAALLRLDALFKSYGPYDHPRWLASAQPLVAAAAGTITPDWQWRRDATPYAGGDPINYLKFAREMRHFYAAHVREPMFPAIARAGLALSGGADVGISLTSIACGLLTLVAAYALGALVASQAAGLAAAAMMGIDQSAVYWSIGGWRDELFAFFAVSCAWAWVRFSRDPGRTNAVLAGVLSGGACLTRITTFALIAPAILWLATNGTNVRANLAIAVGIMTVIVAPFLINCALATGDPLYAINNHTEFYLDREAASDSGTAARPDVAPVSAVKYTLDKFESRPIAATDNAVRGIFVYPFSNKWTGLDEWYPGLGRALACLAIAGMVAWLWSADGRLLLYMLFGALVPFSMTWTVLGGAEWRLTLFAYAFYLIAAFWVVGRLAHFVRLRVRAGGGTGWPRPSPRRILRPAGVVLALLAVAGVWVYAVPYAVAREAIAYGDPVTIMAGPRDGWFFRDGWSGTVVEGNVTIRRSTKPLAMLRLFLPTRRTYGLTLRVNPVSPSAGSRQILRLAMNGQPLDELVLGWNPERIGQYDVTIPARMVVPGNQQLALRSDTSFKLWYVRITPQ
jgi:hypothetical protein